MTLSTLIKISRPRFWLYTAGSYWVGAIAGADQISDILTWNSLVYLVYFVFFANVFIYGINDLFDEDTDVFNAKKEDKEHRLASPEKNSLRLWVFVSLALGVVLAFLAPSGSLQTLWLGFLFLAGAYSATPFRFKARPFIDAASNIHYAVVGFIGYTYFAGHLPPVWAIVAAWCWTAAMHIYSAVPDIAADTQAKLRTTAVVLGKNKALLFCALLWLGTTVSLWKGGFLWPWSLVTLIYVFSALYLVGKSDERIIKTYWYFPYINGLLGLILFWVLAWSKL